MRRLFLLLCLGIILSATLSGCGGDSNIKDAPYENVPLEDIEGNDLAGASAERLYQAGHTFLVAGEADNALKIYTGIQSRFPFSPIATQAALETVTAHYMHEDYAKAVTAADRFIKQHPRHPNIDYLYYLRGLSNYHRNDPGLLGGNPDQRDLSYLKQAFSDFKLLIRNFPGSVYAKDAQMHMIKIRNRLADFELSVAEYYLERHAYVAAVRRASYIIKHYQRSAATPRALEIMQESYLQLGLPALGEDARSILLASYPGYVLHRNEFYAQRANNYYGDDALPGHDSEKLVPHEVGPVKSMLGEIVPWKNLNSGGAWHQWLEGTPTQILGVPSSDDVKTNKTEKGKKKSESSKQQEESKTQRRPVEYSDTTTTGNADTAPADSRGQPSTTTPAQSEKDHVDIPQGRNSGSQSKWLQGKPTQTM